jgi:16S rRNA G966 N2-methylase RsmD
VIDPPYKDKTIEELVEQLAESKLVGEHTIIVMTHSSRFPLQPNYGTMQLFKEHRHGDSTISLYRKEN